MNFNQRFIPWAALFGRLLIALLFVLSVAKKLAGPAALMAQLEGLGLPFPGLFYALAVLFELVGTLMLLLGWQARFGAVLLILFTVLATVLVHLHPDDPAQMSHVFKNAAIIGGLLQVLAFGAGAFSIDHKRRPASA